MPLVKNPCIRGLLNLTSRNSLFIFLGFGTASLVFLLGWNCRTILLENCYSGPMFSEVKLRWVMFFVHWFHLSRVAIWHAFILSWYNGFWSSCQVTVRSWWLLPSESLGFPLSSLFPDFICFWWTNLSWAISDLYPASPMFLLYLLLLPWSQYLEFISLKYFLSLTSLTVSVTLKVKWRPVFLYPLWLSIQILCLVGTVRCSAEGTSLVASLRICSSLDVVLYFLQLIFQKSNVFLCFPNRNVYYDVWVCYFKLPSSHFENHCCDVSLPPTQLSLCPFKLLLTSHAFAVCHFPSSVFHNMLCNQHIFIVNSTEEEIEIDGEKKIGPWEYAEKYIGFTASVP